MLNLLFFFNRSHFPRDPSKQWSNAGCHKNFSTEEYTICHCYHLTSYGLIMDVHGIYVRTHSFSLSQLSLILHSAFFRQLMATVMIYFQDELGDTHKETLKYISLVGCCVSIFFCILSVLGFSFAM